MHSENGHVELNRKVSYLRKWKLDMLIYKIHFNSLPSKLNGKLIMNVLLKKFKRCPHIHTPVDGVARRTLSGRWGWGLTNFQHPVQNSWESQRYHLIATTTVTLQPSWFALYLGIRILKRIRNLTYICLYLHKEALGEYVKYY